MDPIEYSTQRYHSLADLNAALCGKEPRERMEMVDETVRDLLAQNDLIQAAEVGRMAGVNRGWILELVAMKYIECGDLVSAMNIARELPKTNYNDPFVANIEREVARMYIQGRADLGSARKIAAESIYLDVQKQIREWIAEENPDRLEFTNNLWELGQRLDEFNSVFYKV